MKLDIDTIEIRKVKEKDLPEIVRIWNVNYKVLTSTNRIHTLESITEWFKTQNEANHEMFGVYLNELLIGFMFLHYKEQGLWIKMTAIKEEFQHQGLGKKFILYALKERNSQKLYTEAKVENYIVVNAILNNRFQIIKYNNDLNEYLFQYF